MYEMYPDTWTKPDQPQPSAPDAKPRRRARRPHSAMVPVRVAAKVASSRPVSVREAWT